MRSIITKPDLALFFLGAALVFFVLGRVMGGQNFLNRIRAYVFVLPLSLGVLILANLGLRAVLGPSIP